MPERIPQSVTIRVAFLAYLASDHVTPATGKTIVVTISKNCAAYGNPSAGATNATAVANGLYYVDLSTTDTGTLGPLAVHGAEGTIDNVDVLYNVVNANNAGLAALPNAAAQAAGGLFTMGSGAGQINQAANGQVDINVSTIKGQAVTCGAGVTVPASLAAVGSNMGTVSSVTGNVSGNVVGTVGKSAMTLASTDVTGNLPADLKNVTVGVDFSATMKTALNAATPAVTVSDKTGFSLSASGVQAIWDALTSALVTAGSIGKRIVDYLTGDIFARIGAPSGASVSVDISAINAKTTNLPASPAAVGSAMTLSAAAVDLIWDEAQAGHTTAGTFGKYLDAQVSLAGGGSLTAPAIADAVWDEAISGHLGLGSTGAKLSAASGASGAGAIAWTYTVNDTSNGNPISGVRVWITTDQAGTNVIASGETNQFGIATFYLDAGPVYVWCTKAGYEFNNPDVETVS
jgi:hypothetical protein